MPSGFVLRPKVDTANSDNWVHTIKSDAGKDYWEHIFAAGDDIYLYSPNDKNVIGTKCAVHDDDIPSISSADGKLTSIKCYARGKVVGSGTFQLYASVGAYATPTDITEAEGYVTAEYDCIEYLDLEDDLWDLEIGGNIGSALIDGVKTLDYVYCEINYTPAAPSIWGQNITALDEGELVSLTARPDKCTWVKEWGFEVRLKATGVLVKKVTWTGKRLPMVAFSTELGLTDGLEYNTTYEGRGYCVTDDDTGAGAWVEFTTRAPDVTTEAASSIGIDHAKGNGTVDASSTERGFEVKLSFAGTLYEYIEHCIAGFEGNVSLSGTTWVGTLVKTVTETGTFSAESFVDDLGRFPIAVFSDKLFAGETYDYRAYAIIGGTTYYGDWVEFTTSTYPSGQLPDDQIPIDDIIPSEPPVEPVEPWGPPSEPIEPIEPIEPFVPPGVTWPDFPYPDIPPWNGSWLGWFYYRKAYTKKDLDDLRRKCRIFQDNSVEYALVVNHNSRVLQQFLNNMTEYMSKDEHNTFRPIIPTQHLNTLARRPLDILDFKEIINNFINNSIDNANNVNNNFRLIRDGLSDYTYTEDEGFVDISITTRLVNDNNPDVDRLKKVVDRLNKEMANNYTAINHNLHVLRAILI